jgi:hypothetical protein
VKTGWRLAWQTLMRELAPQSPDGSYARPSYTFNSAIGDPGFPVRILGFCGMAWPTEGSCCLAMSITSTCIQH